MFKSSIESIVSDIVKKISKLRVLSGEHHNLHLVHTEESIRHTDLANEQLLQRDKAAKIADKLEALIN